MSLERFCRKFMIEVRPEATVREAAEKMKNHHVGAVVVTPSEHGKPVGILTDRDIVCRVVGDGLDPDRTAISQVMSQDPTVLHVDDSIDDALVTMRKQGIRRAPILDPEGALAGSVSLDDLVVMLSAELNQTAGVVRNNRGP